MTDEEPEKREGEELSEEQAVERLRKLLGEQADELGKDVIQEAAPETAANDPPALAELERELEIFEARFDESAEQRKARMESDVAFDDRLREIEEKATRIKADREQKEREQERRRSSEQDDAKQLGVGLSIVYVVVGLPLAGALIGWFLDDRFGAQIWKGFGLLIGAALAVLMAFTIIKRSNLDK